MTFIYRYLLSQCFSHSYSNPRHYINIGLSFTNSIGLSLNNSIGFRLNNSMSLNNTMDLSLDNSIDLSLNTSIGLSLANSIVLHVYICVLHDHTRMGFGLQTAIE